jgi:phospholipid/cholesterol/gamma-HCH transport system substrate-binding protein
MRILRSHRLIGLVFLALMAGSLWFTWAIFSKKFTDYDEVTLQTSKIGLQMPERADVKYRGVIVGEVLDFKPTTSGAEVTLGLFPDQVKTIPADVTGSILPKTLFGEKYVALESASGKPSPAIRRGDVIDRTAVATEVEQVLSDLLPLLRTVQPEQLNYFLNAMATALEGRGADLGDGLSNIDAYLKQFNPEAEALIEDLRKTAEVSDLYAEVLPDLAEVLRNTVTTGNTIEEREAELQKLFAETTAFSNTAQSFLAANEKNLIRLGQVTSAQMKLFARYAPEYPCLLGGIAGVVPKIDETFRGHMLHINLELLPNQPRGYTTADAPINGDKRGPYCGTLPSPPHTQANPLPPPPDFNDGIEKPTGKGTRRAATGSPAGIDAAYVGTEAEAGMLRALLGQVFGVPTEEVSDLSVLMIAPMARGAEVSVR